MDDKLKKFITDHREEFDLREPDPSIWQRVEGRIRVSSPIRWQMILSRAAAVVLIFAASYAVNDWIHSTRSRNISDHKTGKPSKENEIPGLKEAEAYYTDLVKQKLDELEPIMANCPSLQEELNVDLSELDSVYTALKADLKDNMANQEVIEAIIENYRLKIRILEDLQSEMDPLGDDCLSNQATHAL
jgi:hypothetical protein